MEATTSLTQGEAAVALANKVARRLWASEHHGTSFDPEHISRREPRAA